MRSFTDGRCRRQISFLRRQFLQDDGLPFGDVLSAKTLTTELAAIEGGWVDRIYTPLTTLWVFLGQVLNADHSCRAAVARLIAHRVALGQSPCSAQTGAYCQARKRLPEEFFATAARTIGRKLEEQAERAWLWRGHHVYLFDGTTTLMPDSSENRVAYPFTHNQKEGLPLARVGAVISLSCGVILDLATARYAGKGQGEVTLLRQLSKLFTAGDVLLGDCLMGNWQNFLELGARGVHVVTRLNRSLRAVDFRLGERLGKEDHLVRWPRPWLHGVSGAAQRAMPDWVTVREARVHIRQPGFRNKVIVIVTNLLDPVRYPKEALAELYRRRWNNELDLRSIKTEMGMECLRCKTPDLVHKEIWAHALAYNLIRTIMAQAATKHGLEPRTVSFKGTLQTLEAFRPVIALLGHSSSTRADLYRRLLEAVAQHRVGDRPNRFEPRRIKRRHKHYVPLSVPRHEAKLQILKGLAKN